jgi:hypothetical protein
MKDYEPTSPHETLPAPPYRDHDTIDTITEEPPMTSPMTTPSFLVRRQSGASPGPWHVQVSVRSHVPSRSPMKRSAVALSAH